MTLLEIHEPGETPLPHAGEGSLAVGIDLGTTNSVVAIAREGKPAALHDETGKALVPSVVAYPAAGTAEKPELTLALLREGTLVARSSPDLPAPDEKGRIAYIATIPSTGLSAGRYEVRAILRQGTLMTEETAFFNK